MDQSPIDWSKLSKKERKALAKEQKRQRLAGEKKKVNIGKWLSVGIVTFVLVAGALWIVSSVIKESSMPLPGKAISILGRNHVPVGTKIKYNSNPPTSGDHYADWTKSGVYDKPIEDGHLVHSLEHGYVILHHNCEAENSKLNPSTRRVPDGNPSSSGQNSKVGTGSAKITEDCKIFVDKLKERVKKDAWKLILVPRKDLDTNFSLTAWGRIDKFNIQESSMDRVNSFIRSLRNNGPEKTME